MVPLHDVQDVAPLTVELRVFMCVRGCTHELPGNFEGVCVVVECHPQSRLVPEINVVTCFVGGVIIQRNRLNEQNITLLLAALTSLLLSINQVQSGWLTAARGNQWCN